MARRRVQSLAQVGEIGFLAGLLPSLHQRGDVVVGPGDDCAVVRVSGRRLLITTDALVDRVHFQTEWMSPTQIGRKAFLVNASDIAAMGGRPRFCVVSAGAPSELSSVALAAMHRGIAAAARTSGVSVVGGNLCRASELFLSLTLIGDPPAHPLLRHRMKPGDGIYVTGTLGDAALGLSMLRRNDRARGRPVRRFREPQPRLREGALLARPGHATAMIDVSDGLQQDLHRLCRASRVSAAVFRHRVPVSAQVRRAGFSFALNGGEDYELLCAVPDRNRARVENVAKRFECGLTRIGRCVAGGDEVKLLDESGRSLPTLGTGFDHFD